jgi:hypothetical protein
MTEAAIADGDAAARTMEDSAAAQQAVMSAFFEAEAFLADMDVSLLIGVGVPAAGRTCPRVTPPFRGNPGSRGGKTRQ